MTISSVAAGNVIDPAWGNAVADAINAHEDAWTTFSPILTNVTLGNGVKDARYNEIGKTVHYAGYIRLGSTTSITGDVSVQTPTNASVVVNHGGWAEYLDAGASFYAGSCRVTSSSTIELHQPANGSNSGRVNATVPFTFGTNDVLSWSITYESA